MLNGWAVAYRLYSYEYTRAEQLAKSARRGIWQGEFVPPWQWRRGERLAAPNTGMGKADKPASKNCRIRGNISKRGTRIYHVPGGKFYDRTRIDEWQGEMWFCSKKEARAAAWRRSKR